jgi:serine/threonine protein phosphatase PrpC
MVFPGHTRSFFSAALSHAGRIRERNEDALLDRPDLGLWAVADGMGGHYAGDYASSRIVDALHDIDPPADPSGFMESVRNRLGEVDSELRDRAAALGPDVVIASTVVALLVFGDYFACVWAGDSRLYLVRDGVIRQLTRDHSRLEEQSVTACWMRQRSPPTPKQTS